MARSRKKSGGGGSPNKKLPLNQSIPLGIQHVLAINPSQLENSIKIEEKWKAFIHLNYP